jgi:hypothetical protein
VLNNIIPGGGAMFHNSEKGGRGVEKKRGGRESELVLNNIIPGGGAMFHNSRG